MDDLDAALDGLESAAPALPEKDSSEAAAQSEPKPGGPPPIRKRSKGGRTEFEGLFVSDSRPMPKVGGIDEKIEYFREKLRRAETQVGRIKEAWAIREEEMDGLEATLQVEKKRADENQEGCEDLQQFLGQKKSEFEDYGAKVAAAFAEHESLDAAHTARIAELEAELDELRAGGTAIETRLRGEIEALRAAATAQTDDLRDELKRTRKQKDELGERVEELTESESAAQRQLRQAFGDAATDETEHSQIENELRAALEKSRADGKKLKRAAAALEKKLEETTATSKRNVEEAQGGNEAKLTAAMAKIDALHRDLDTRTDLIKRLKGIAESAKEKISERNGKIKKLEEVNRVLAAQSVDSLDEPAPAGPSADEVQRAMKTLALAEKSLRDVEEDHATLCDQFEAAQETRIGDAAKKLRRILTVTIKLLGGGD